MNLGSNQAGPLLNFKCISYTSATLLKQFPLPSPLAVIDIKIYITLVFMEVPLMQWSSLTIQVYAGYSLLLISEFHIYTTNLCSVFIHLFFKWHTEVPQYSCMPDTQSLTVIYNIYYVFYHQGVERWVSQQLFCMVIPPITELCYWNSKEEFL